MNEGKFENGSVGVNAKLFLTEFVDGGIGANLGFVSMVAELVNESAILNKEQQAFVLRVVQAGPTDDTAQSLMDIATFINSCR